MVVGAWVIGAAMLACSKQDPSPVARPEATQQAITSAPAPATTASAPTDPAAAARGLFQARCVVCHGNHGGGDGVAATALNPKPRAFGDPAWQASVTDDHIATVIVEGGVAVGKSPGMPANPELRSKPDVVRELVRLVRAFKKD